MGQRFWACHNHWKWPLPFRNWATKLLRPWLFLVNFEVQLKGLLTDTETSLMTMWVFWTSSRRVQECHFRAPWSRTNSKKWLRGFCPSIRPASKLTPPLKLCTVVYSMQYANCFKPTPLVLTDGFFVSSIWLMSSPLILTLFAPIMVNWSKCY